MAFQDIYTMSFNPWNPLGLDTYALLKPLLFVLDPERIHELTLKALQKGYGPDFITPNDPTMAVKVDGLEFPCPVGLAAGYDRQAQVIDELMRFGFGSVEVGTIKPTPFKGNPAPRLFWIKDAKAILQRLGEPSDGSDVVAQRMKDWREKPGRTQNPVGINISPNAESADPAAELVESLNRLAPYADYATVNLSLVKAPPARTAKYRVFLKELLVPVMETRGKLEKPLPVFVKMSPDLTEAQQKDVSAIALEIGLQGIIVGDTTASRPSNVPRDLAAEEGGLAGGPLFSLSTRVLSNMYRFTKGKVLLIGCGGVLNGEDAYAKIRAGASMVQIHTALCLEGPMVVNRIKRELAILLRRDKFETLADAVGADHREKAITVEA